MSFLQPKPIKPSLSLRSSHVHSEPKLFTLHSTGISWILLQSPQGKKEKISTFQHESQIKLIYFDAKGRAELSRLILAQAGVDYEDFRFKREDWPELKKTMPVGQVPAMEYNGEIISQSMAIARFLAREFHLYGKTSWEAAKADMVADCVSDLYLKAYPVVFEKDETKKEELMETFKSEHLDKFLGYMEKLLEKNGGKYFVGDELTYADIAVADAMNAVEGSLGLGAEWKEKSPKMDKFVQSVLSLPNIKKWIETRPN